MIIIKAETLEMAMSQASAKFECSVTQLHIEVVEYPKRGLLGMFKKQAVIAVVKKQETTSTPKNSEKISVAREPKVETPKVETVKAQSRERKTQTNETKARPLKERKEKPQRPQAKEKVSKPEARQSFVSNHSDMMTPSLVTAQDDYDVYDENEYKKSETPVKSKRSKEDVQRRIAKVEEEESSIKRVNNDTFKESTVVDGFFQSTMGMDEIVAEVDKSVNRLFSKSCFSLSVVEVSAYDDNTLLVEFSGDDAALLIGKEGYRYKALSYMLFNWINAKYGVQLRLEIAEFLKNQEEMVHKYLENVFDQVKSNGRAQTKILDGVLVQIALKKLRSTFPDKYVAIRTNREGLKYIIINSFRANNG